MDRFFFLEDVFGMLQDDAPVVVQDDAFAYTVKKLYPELVLQRGDRAAQLGLGDEEFFGCFGKMLEFSDFFEKIQTVEIHR